jgi:hypothetical protein
VSGDWLEPVRGALDRSARRVAFFFRDDDGGWRDDRLAALLDLFAERAMPLDLALIPSDLGAGIAGELAGRCDRSEGRLGLHQHGLAHRNHEPEGRKCEFGPGRSHAEQLDDIAAGRGGLRARLGERVQPIFTPPWNRCTAVTGHCLAELGFTALSRESRAEPLHVPGLIELPVRFDWFAQRKRVRLGRLERAQLLASEIERARDPVGLMFHHALMDDAELRDAEQLLDLLAGHSSASARAMNELIERGSGKLAGSAAIRAGS